MDKRALVAALRARIAADIAEATRAARDAAAAATHEEAKPENDKDTRGLEQSYLARGQAERVKELERADNALSFLPLRDFGEGDSIAASALVDLDHAGSTSSFFVVPVGGGVRVQVEGEDVQVVTAQSPMGQALLGKSAGDEVTVRGREYVIARVR